MEDPKELDEAGPYPGASWLNKLVAFVRSCQVVVGPDSGLTSRPGPDGQAIGIQDTPTIWAKVTFAGPSASYSWREQVPSATTAGGWTDGARIGYVSSDPARGSTHADPAWEANANASVATGTIVDMTRDPAVGRMTFRSRAC